MFFQEDSDGELLDESSSPIATYRAELQRCARRNLSKAVIFAHDRCLRTAFRNLRSNITNLIDMKDALQSHQNRNGKLPIWQQGQHFQRQRHHRLRIAMNNLLENTGRHKKTKAASYLRCRTLARVFGAILQVATEDQAVALSAYKHAEKHQSLIQQALKMRTWVQIVKHNRNQRDLSPLSDNFSALVLLQRGFNMLYSKYQRKRKQHPSRIKATAHHWENEMKASRAALHLLRAQSDRRRVLAKLYLLRRNCMESARLALQMLYINIGNRAGIATHDRRRAQRKHRGWLLKCGLRRLIDMIDIKNTAELLVQRVSPSRHRILNGIIYMSTTTNISHRQMYQRDRKSVV